VDLVVSGSLPRALVHLALPAVGCMLLNTAFGVVDTFWVGRLGREAMAAMSAASFFLWSMYALISLVDVGTRAHVSRRAGERDWAPMARAAGEGIVLCLPVSAVAIAFYMAITESAFGFMHVTGDVATMARAYLDVILLGLPVMLVFWTISAIFQGAGDTRTPFWLLGGSFLLNAVLDPVLIFGWGPIPALGLRGAALATVGSQAVGAIPGIVLLVRRDLISLGRPLLSAGSLSILRIGLPTFAEGFLFCVVYVFIVRLLLPFGVAGLAALGVGHRLESISYMIALGFSHAAATLVGQCLGARLPGRAARGAWLAVGIVSAVALVVSALFLMCPRALISIFIQDPGTVAQGEIYLRIVALSQVAMVVELTLFGAFQGAGDTVPPMVVSVSLTAARVPLAYLLAHGWGLGSGGIYWAIALTTILKGVILGVWFLTGRWKTRKI
jgi:putative MATE family efflux protein